MLTIRFAAEADRSLWFSLDRHIGEGEFLLKIRDKRGYVIEDGDRAVGVLRYNLFWDIIPFLTFIGLCESERGKGFGRRAMLDWEHQMRSLGHQMVMTSTQIDEEAQHFYRKLGYLDRGSLFLDGTPYAQPQEVFLLKVL